MKFEGFIGECRGFSIPISPYKGEEREALSELEVESLINSCPDILSKALIKVGFELGLRSGEIEKIDVHDFKPEERLLRVRRLKTRGDSAGDSFLPVSDELADTISTYLKEWREKISLRDKDALFVTRSGRKVIEPDLSMIIRSVAKKTGIKRKVSWHILRHSRISQLSSQKMYPIALARLMAHKSVLMTLEYSHLSPQQLREELEKVGAF